MTGAGGGRCSTREAHPEIHISEPQDRRQDCKDPLDHFRRDLNDLKGQPEVVKLDDVVDTVESDAAGLIEVVVLGCRLQKKPFRKFLVSLKTN